MLTAQIIGSAITCIATFSVAMAVMLAVNAMGILRVSKEGELEGLDLHEHGISAYPEYVISSIATPAAMTISRDSKVPVESHARVSYGEAQR